MVRLLSLVSAVLSSVSFLSASIGGSLFGAVFAGVPPTTFWQASGVAPLRLDDSTLCPGSEEMDLEVEGFGADTLGGWYPQHETVCVTSLADSGPGSLREACDSGSYPRVIRFAVEGRIELLSPIALPSYLTIDGRGRDVVVVGKGMLLHGVSDIILTHFALEDVHPNSEDGIQIGFPDISPTTHVVIDHLRFAQADGMGSADEVDEAISVIYGSSDITVQWCHFKAWEKVMLLGNGDASPEVDSQMTVTIHHNYFESTGRRHPMGRWGQFDVYNNLLQDWHMFDRVGPPTWHESFGLSCEEGCEMRSEQNVFERYWHTEDTLSEANQASRCELGGLLDERLVWIYPATRVPLQFGYRCTREGTWERPYPAAIDVADAVLRERLMEETGPNRSTGN